MENSRRNERLSQQNYKIKKRVRFDDKLFVVRPKISIIVYKLDEMSWIWSEKHRQEMRQFIQMGNLKGKTIRIINKANEKKEEDEDEEEVEMDEEELDDERLDKEEELDEEEEEELDEEELDEEEEELDEEELDEEEEDEEEDANDDLLIVFC